jgi:hypothetical protein
VIRMLVWGSLVTVGAWRAQECAENPDYKLWAPFKPGSWVTLETVKSPTATAPLFRSTLTLLDLNEDRALIEVSTKPLAGGDHADPLIQQREIRAFVPRGLLKAPLGDGIEEISVAGTKFLCHWIEEMNDRARIRTWNTVGVPGGVIRRKITREGSGDAETVEEAVLWKLAP